MLAVFYLLLKEVLSIQTIFFNRQDTGLSFSVSLSIWGITESNSQIYTWRSSWGKTIYTQVFTWEQTKWISSVLCRDSFQMFTLSCLLILILGWLWVHICLYLGKCFGEKIGEAALGDVNSAILNKKSCWLFLFLLKRWSYELGKLGICLCYTLEKFWQNLTRF